MQFIIKTTGTTEGFEHYYGDIIFNNKVIDSWYYKPSRNVGIYIARKARVSERNLFLLTQKVINRKRG